jgi:hypothetical protein
MDEQPKTSDEPGEVPAAGSRLLQQPRVRLGAVVALAVAAGVIAWAVVGKGTTGSGSSTPTSPVVGPNAVKQIGPVGLNVSRLRTLARSVKEPIYWAGPKRGYTYELIRTRDSKVFIRYLPQGVKVGDKRANFMIVATYPFANAFASLKKLSQKQTQAVKGGGIALVDKTYPKSVHMAFRGVNYQIEVYDPSPADSLRVALSGIIRPVV